MYKRANTWLRKSFISGLITVLPFYFTYKITLILVSFTSSLLPQLLFTGHHWGDFLVQLVSAFFFLLILGSFAHLFVGKRVISGFGSLYMNIPVVRGIYGFFFTFVRGFWQKEKVEFDQPVLVEYPREGSYSLGFICAKTSDELKRPIATNNGMVAPQVSQYHVYLPYTPWQGAGFLSPFELRQIQLLPVSTDKAIAYMLSCGIIS